MFSAIASLCFGFAVVLVAMTGIAATLGAQKLRDGLGHCAAYATIAGMCVVYATPIVHGAIDYFYISYDTSSIRSIRMSAFTCAFVFGHVGFAAAWIYTRFGPLPVITNIERARGRGRERVMPALEPELRDD
jgi:hypothetical protein